MKTPLRCSSILTLALALAFSLPARAWNATGHRITAELAWRALSRGERQAVSQLLRAHPHYALLLATNVPAGVDTNEWAFLTAAVWPDLVRPAYSGEAEKPASITSYHRSQWHYINIPYVWPKDASRIAASSFTIPTTNVIWATTNSIALLKDRHTPAPERAVSLCWMLHLVGDLHQPLHSSTLLSVDYPQGDQGGNLLAVADASQTPLNLHSFWDQILGDGDSYTYVSLMSDGIGLSPQYAPKHLPELRRDLTVRSWVEESHAAAIAFGYLDGRLKFADWRAFNSGSIAAADVPRLRTTYIMNAQEVARRRASLAGRRMAVIIKQAF